MREMRVLHSWEILNFPHFLHNITIMIEIAYALVMCINWKKYYFISFCWLILYREAKK